MADEEDVHVPVGQISGQGTELLYFREQVHLSLDVRYGVAAIYQGHVRRARQYRIGRRDHIHGGCGQGFGGMLVSDVPDLPMDEVHSRCRGPYDFLGSGYDRRSGAVPREYQDLLVRHVDQRSLLARPA